MANKKWEIRNKKLLLISYFLLLIFIVACGRRGDPIAIIPYKAGIDSKEAEPDSYGEVGVVNDCPVIAETVTVVFNNKNRELSKNIIIR